MKRFVSMSAIICLAGILAGAPALWLYNRSTVAVTTERLAERERQSQQANADLKGGRIEIRMLSSESTLLNASYAAPIAKLERGRKSAAERFAAARQAAVERQALLKPNPEAPIPTSMVIWQYDLSLSI